MNAANAIPILAQNLSEEKSMVDEMITQLWPEFEGSFAMSEEEAQELQ